MASSSTHPTILVIFGATGDVVAKKIIPAIAHLFQTQALPKLFHVVAFSRRPLSDQDFRDHVREVMTHHKDIPLTEEQVEQFCKLFTYSQGQFQEAEAYQRLGVSLGRVDGEWKACANKLFYLAVPPSDYEPIFQNLASSGLTIPCSDNTGWTRVLVEKPIGMDSESSEHLDRLMSQYFQETQIYRIEHYLAKEMVRNLLVFRFANNLFEGIWSREHIEQINIRLWETLGVENRGNFYDNVGTLRDVGQNHLLQMLALMTMEQPEKFEADAIRKGRANVLHALRPPTPENMAKETYHAQYTGYQQIVGVKPDSQTETYFKLKTTLDLPRWRDVPIVMEAGKRQGSIRKEIVILFKHPEPCLCPTVEHLRNRIVISLEPYEGIKVDVWAKKPGHEFVIEQRSLDFLYRDAKDKVQYVEEYEKVLLDAIEGDQTLFVSTDELASMWKFIDPIIDAWKSGTVPLDTYTPDTDEAVLKSKHLED